MPSKWIHRFELKPGKWVFHPSPESIILGREIKSSIEKVWIPPDNYFHLRAGGHVRALQAHLKSKYFLHLDIKDFFGSVNRSRVTRCLDSRFGYARAREMANASTVQHPDKKGKFMLPYGFVQSPVLASLALAESAFGSYLDRLSKTKEFVVSVYVDDILISGATVAILEEHLLSLTSMANRSRFDLNELKQEGPAPTVTAFNVELSHSNLQLRSDRLDEFKEAFINATSDHQKLGIFGYVQSVNSKQALVLST